MKNTIPNYDERIKPLIKEIQKNKGMEAKIVAEFGKLMGEPVHRNIVHGWLHPNAKKRNEPSYTRGMRLFEAITIAMVLINKDAQLKERVK
jgi:hypothetical protein